MSLKYTTSDENLYKNRQKNDEKESDFHLDWTADLQICPKYTPCDEIRYQCKNSPCRRLACMFKARCGLTSTSSEAASGRKQCLSANWIHTMIAITSLIAARTSRSVVRYADIRAPAICNHHIATNPGQNILNSARLICLVQ